MKHVRRVYFCAVPAAPVVALNAVRLIAGILGMKLEGFSRVHSTVLRAGMRRPECFQSLRF